MYPIILDPALNKHREATASDVLDLPNTVTISAQPKVFIVPTQIPDSPLNDGWKVLVKANFKIIPEGIPQWMLDSGNLHLELLHYKSASRQRRYDPIRGTRYVRKPAGWYHPSDLTGTGSTSATGGGNYADGTGRARTCWKITSSASILLTGDTVLCKWFKRVRIFDQRGFDMDFIGSTSNKGNVNASKLNGQHGVSNKKTIEKLAFRWAYHTPDGKVIQGPNSDTIYAGCPRSVSKPTGNTDFINVGISGRYAANDKAAGMAATLSAGFTPKPSHFI
jgi:hypothetical protein